LLNVCLLLSLSTFNSTLKNTDGNKYATVSTCLLRDLLDRWDAVEDDVDTMTNQLCTVLTDI